MATNRKPLVVFGSITMDLVTRTPRIPLVGQTVIGSSFESTPGGKGANQAIAAARLGYPAKMIGKVGDDAYGPELIENLKLAGVDTSSMTQSSGSSGLAPLFVADDGSNAIVVVPGANGKMDRATVDANKELLSSAGMPRHRLWSLMMWARVEAQTRKLTPQELLNDLRAKICKQVLADRDQGATLETNDPAHSC